VPERYRWLFDLNPMTNLVNNFRGPIYQHAFPSWHALLAGFSVAMVTMVAGWWLFTRTADDLPYQA
jgi:ABC-type polysaccharide/polyol phosphate export permease